MSIHDFLDGADKALIRPVKEGDEQRQGLTIRADLEKKSKKIPRSWRNRLGGRADQWYGFSR